MGNAATTVISRELWKLAAQTASLLEPCVEDEVRNSDCTPQTYFKANLRQLAVACGVPVVRKMAAMEDALGNSDDLVGPSCPIPRDAALYLLHLAWRRVSLAFARDTFCDRNFDVMRTCIRPKVVRYRDMRSDDDHAAPMMLHEVSPRLQRRVILLKQLDAEFEVAGKARPWRVRTQEQAAQYHRRERLLAAGYPSIVASWASEAEALAYKELCEELGCSMTKYAIKDGVNYDALTYDFTRTLPEMFHSCREMRRVDSAFFVRRIRDGAEDCIDPIRGVPLHTQQEAIQAITEEGNRAGEPATFTPTMRNVADAIELHHLGLPVVVALWYTEGNLIAIARDAVIVSRLLDVDLHENRYEFERNVVECLECLFPSTEPISGIRSILRFI